MSRPALPGKRASKAAIADAVRHARQHCAAADAQLTPLREQVLGLLVEHGGPAKAYELLARMQQLHPGTAPMTVYRALDFLVEQGLAHKIHATSSFVACARGHHGAQPPAFMICERCGQTREADAGVMPAALRRQARGFVAHSVEIKGLCAQCGAAA